VSADSGSSIFDGVGGGVNTVGTFVANGVNTGFFDPTTGVRSPFCLFLKVFLAVGDVADSVSNLRLVEALPNTGLTSEVLSVNFGLFEGDGNVDAACWL